MKFAVAAASVLASVYSQTQPQTTPKLDAKCLDDGNGIERLLIEIPYPNAEGANILSLVAGTCNENDYISLGGEIDPSNDMVKIWIPIDACNMRGDLYHTPKVTKSYSLNLPTATVTFGTNIGGTDVIFRRLPIAAECGSKTSYTVKFDYNNLTQVEADGCTDVEGVCVFPAYGEDAKFIIKEFTNSNFDVEVNNTNNDDTDDRAFVAGTPIFLSMQVTDLPADQKFAVTECRVTDGDNSLILLNPGAEDTAESTPSCEIREIGLSGTYDGLNFNFQHTLFLLNAALAASTFTLECTVEVCNRNEASSTCNQAAAVCIKDHTEVKEHTEAEQNESMKEYMCAGLCGTEEVCSFDAEIVSCSGQNQCSCSNGASATGSSCTTNNGAICSSCNSGYRLSSGSCIQNQCTCSNGVSATGSSCTTNNDNICSSCDSGYRLSSGSCIQNQCTCSNGVIATGASCTTNNDNICSSCESGYTLVSDVCTKSNDQYLMYILRGSDVIYSYTFDSSIPVLNDQFTIPYTGNHRLVAFNSQLGMLEVIGDIYSSTNTNHKMMTVAGSFSDAPDSLFNGDNRFDVVHSRNVGTLVFSGYGHSGSTLVYIITQNSDWNKIDNSDKYLSDFQNPNPGKDYYGFGVVEQDDKIYLVGGTDGTGTNQNTVQVVNFRDVDDLLTAQTRQWIFMENLKNAVSFPAVIHRENEILIVAYTGDSSPPICQDVQYLNLAANTTGVYGDTIECGMDGRGYIYPGIYSIGNSVSIFGGYGAEKSCMQQFSSGLSDTEKWQCFTSSESALEGLGYHSDGSSGYIRYSNFVL